MKSSTTSFISAWNVADALVRPKDITKNSEVAIMSSDHCLLYDGFVHPNLVPAVQIKLGEEPSIVEFTEEFVHYGNQEHVAHDFGVQGTLINT
jgi:hypothetical protein